MTQRHDGWTAPRKQAFLEALTQYGSVQKAAHAVGMSPSSAYRARLRDDQAFRDAWAVAVEVTVRTLHESAVERAIHGTINPVFYKGEIVGERVVHDSRLLIFMLRMHAPDIFDVPGGVSLVDAPNPNPNPIRARRSMRSSTRCATRCSRLIHSAVNFVNFAVRSTRDCARSLIAPGSRAIDQPSRESGFSSTSITRSSRLGRPKPASP